MKRKGFLLYSALMLFVSCNAVKGVRTTTGIDVIGAGTAVVTPSADVNTTDSSTSSERSFLMKTPTVEVFGSDVPRFEDEGDFKNMELAITRQLVAFKRFGLRGEIELGGELFKLSILKDSLELFRQHVRVAIGCLQSDEKRTTCYNNFDAKLKDNFRFYGPQFSDEHDPGRKVIFTAYYSPIYEAALKKGGEYQFPIYAYPGRNHPKRKSTFGQIMFDGALKGEGLELFYMKDLFDMYTLHIEGGGAVNVNGKMHFLSFAGSNSNKLTFLSSYMKRKGYISNGSTKAQRAYLDANPDKHVEIFSANRSYVYFKPSKTDPLGLEDIPLTNNRSIAQDKKIYKRKGLLAFITAKKPVKDANGNIVYKKYSQFYIDQDTGSRILGGARADIYFGFGEEAELAGHNLHDLDGQMFYLIKK